MSKFDRDRNLMSLRRSFRTYNGTRRRLIAEIVSKCRDCTTRNQVRKTASQLLDQAVSSRKLRFGVVEVLAIIQLIMAVWAFIKKMGWLESATPDAVEEMLNDA